ncbi:MAG: cob(I)yrinic acid a,c-diamide adenosyltransferase [Spirochaetaceae bacterium]|jgi:cob(I)alamin adenosyltransferase|nr:cob(I)yrinic acid a,c-diamide adenosyltransferase [Spirochaetaceae bacterium]
MNGLIHLYVGDGKGKTTAVTGLAVRAAGHSLRVIFAQFLKNGSSGELAALSKLGVTLIDAEECFGFTFSQDEETRLRCRKEQERRLNKVRAFLDEAMADLVVLDEVLDALRTGMLDEDALRSFLENTQVEFALTGRSAPAWLIERAAYISEIRKIKHPFDCGIQARIGIER